MEDIMEFKEGIQKVLTSVSADSSLQKSLKEDPEAAIRGIVGDGLEKDEFNKLVKAAAEVVGDSRKSVAFTGILGIPKCIPGLSALLANNGGYELLMNYIVKDECSACASIRDLGILSELLSSQGGTMALIKMIGSDAKSLPDLNTMMALFAGSGSDTSAEAAKPEEAKKPKDSTDSLIDAIGTIFGA